MSRATEFTNDGVPHRDTTAVAGTVVSGGGETTIDAFDPDAFDPDAFAFGAAGSGGEVPVSNGDGTAEWAIVSAAIVAFTPTGGLVATNVQDALEEAAAGMAGAVGSDGADATGDLTTTTTAADVPAATLDLADGIWVVTGVFDVTRNGATNDRVFEGLLDAGGIVPGFAIFSAPVATAGVRATVMQMWRILVVGGGSGGFDPDAFDPDAFGVDAVGLASVKLQARHSGGTAGDFTVEADNSSILAMRSA